MTADPRVHSSDGVIALRPLVAEDLGEFRRLAADKRVELARWYHRDPAEVVDDGLTEIFDAMLQEWAGRFGLVTLVTGCRTGRIIGMVTLNRNDERRLEVSYWVAAYARGAGIATRSLRLVTDEIFAADRYSADRVEAIIDSKNAASQRVAIKAGYEYDCVRAIPAPLIPGGFANDRVYFRER